MKITLYQIKTIKNTQEIIKKLDRKQVKGGTLKATPIQTLQLEEIQITYTYKEKLQTKLEMFMTKEQLESLEETIANYKFENKVHCYYHPTQKLLEIQRNQDEMTDEIAKTIAKTLETEAKKIKFDSKALLELVNDHSTQLKYALFKNIDGLWQNSLRGKQLEKHHLFQEYVQENENSLRVVGVNMNINYINNGKYQVTVNGDKGTIGFIDKEHEKPREEVRQIVRTIQELNN